MIEVPELEWSQEEIKRVGALAVEMMSLHIAQLPEAAVFSPLSPSQADKLRTAPAPQNGIGIEAVLAEFKRDVLPYPFGNGHPRFFGWVNSPPALPGIIAELLAAAMNPSVAGGNHAAVYIEHAVARWFGELIGFPESAKGLLVSGASSAAIIALSTARFAALKRIGWDVRTNGLQPDGSDARAPRLHVYQSGQGHGCHQKAVELLGIGTRNIRAIATDFALRLDARALHDAIKTDKSRGHIPVAVIATAGTVNTGAIDPIDEIADVCQEHNVWLHVDGAYGAPAILSERYSEQLRSISRADSLALDPHKWLYVPVDAGFIIIKDALAMREAASLVPPYLRTEGGENGVQGPPWFSEFGVEQTRPFRALKVWFALKSIGLSGYRTLIDRDLSHADYLAREIAGDPVLELWSPRSLSIVCFRIRGRDGDDSVAADDLNRAVLLDVQTGGQAFLSSTILGERFWLRACIVNHRTRASDLDALLAAVRSARARHLASAGAH